MGECDFSCLFHTESGHNMHILFSVDFAAGHGRICPLMQVAFSLTSFEAYSSLLQLNKCFRAVKLLQSAFRSE